MADNNLIIPDFDRDRDKALKIVLAQSTELLGVLTVFLNGRIDNYNTLFFQRQMEKIIQHGAKKILFRCSALEYISSSGFGVLATYFQKVKQQNGTFVFIDIQPKVLEVFQLLGFDHFFSITNDINDIPNLFDDKNLGKSTVFPKSFACPGCDSTLKASKAGKFRCSHCKVIIKINEDGDVSF